MYLKKDKRPNGRIFLAIVKGYRDPTTKKTRHKQIMRVGYYDELLEDYEDPITHFTQVAKQMTEEENENKEIELTLDMTEKLDVGTNDKKNIGFSVLSRIYHILGIHTFMINRERGLKAAIPLNNILKLLVYERILDPGSKLAAHENKDKYFENFNFPLESIYRSLPILAKYKDKLLLELHENITIKYGRDTSNVYYDVTNYYFHMDQQTELIRKGMGKDKKGKPIIQMGLLLDKAGLPITYKLFSGNTTDFETLLPVLSELKSNYNLNRVIVVADKGLNSGTNKAYNIIKGDGYIFSRSIRGTKASKEIKDYVLDDEDYEWIGEDFKIKSRIYPTIITVKNDEGKDVKIDIDEKHVVFYSKKYAERSRHKRNEAIAKALKLISRPTGYTTANNYGSMKYIKGMKLDKKTGELTHVSKDVIPRLNDDLIKEEEKYDGYYSIVTSELDMTDSEIIEKYRGLWKIEDTFKITKSQLQTRPAYVWSEGGIEGHFLTCFLSLLILRILEMETRGTYSIERLVDSLNKSEVVHLKMNYYQGVYFDEVLKCIDENLGTNLNQKYQTLDGIKKLISDTKQAL
jgi:transposase